MQEEWSKQEVMGYPSGVLSGTPVRNGVVNALLLFVGLLGQILGGREGPLSINLATPSAEEIVRGEPGKMRASLQSPS